MVTTQVWNLFWRNSISANPIPTMSTPGQWFKDDSEGRLPFPDSPSPLPVAWPFKSPSRYQLLKWTLYRVKRDEVTGPHRLCLYILSLLHVFVWKFVAHAVHMNIFLTKVQVKLFIKWIRFAGNCVDCESWLSYFVPMDALMLWKGFLLGFIHKKLNTRLIVFLLSKMQAEWTQKDLGKKPSH